MATVEREKEFNVSANDMWKVIGDFTAIQKWAAVDDVEISDGGKTRTINMGGSKITERLLEDGDLTQSYALDDGGALPVKGYKSTITAKDLGDGKCTVHWSGNFEPADGTTEEMAVQIIGMVYDGGLAGMEKAVS